MDLRTGLAFVVCALVLGARVARSQGAPPRSDSAARSASGVRVATAARIVGAPPVIDGKLNEPAWGATPVATNFSQSYPRPGAAPTQRTEVRVLYDNQALYIGIRMYDTRPDSVAAQLARRDASGIYSDWVHVVIDSYHDRRTAFRFSVNPLGVQKDALEFNDTNEDLNWDAVWEVATSRDSLGWIAEYRIPFSQLRFGAAPIGMNRVWGFQVQRDIARFNERDSWSAWTQQSPGYVSSFGDLTGLRDIPVPQRLELVPYVSSRLTRAPGSTVDPFFRRNNVKPSVGGDLKYGLPSSLTLNATLNPDFGQVEVDPAVVNLSAYETFFPEKRPFFLERSDVFQFGQVQVNNDYGSQFFFYSRRIGRQPERSPGGQGVLYVDAPDATAILGAAKVTGKTGPWTVGVLDAVTNRETARYTTSDGLSSTPVEPLTNYAVGRVQRELRGGNTVVGGMLTLTSRSMGDTVFKGLLRNKAELAGVDFEQAWAKREWIMSGYVAESRVSGSAQAIALTQEASTHYFQRPDASYLHFDPTRTSLTGHIGELAIRKSGALFGSLAYKESSPGFEINDVGYQPRTDYRALSPDVAYQSNVPGRLLRNYTVYAAGNAVWNFGGTPIYDAAALGTNTTFNNLSSLGIQFAYSPTLQNDRLTRGGPLAELPAQWQLSLTGGSDSRKPVVLGAQLTWVHDAAGGYTRSAGPTVDARPASFVHVSLAPTLTLTQSTNQYVRTVLDSLARSTFGSRYVFADLHQTTLSMDTRLDWTFSTKLSLQLYAQPFVSAGKYSTFKQLLAPRTRAFGVYGRDLGTVVEAQGVYTVDPDGGGPAPMFRFGDPTFNIRSLRGDAVLRWEYRQGSALFLVWQQQRNDFAPLGDFQLSRDAGAIFRTTPTNVFLIKVTYWFGF